MIPMLATIDDITAAKVDRDRKVHGVGYLRVRPDGQIEHVPHTLEMLKAEVAARIAKVAE